MMKTSIFAYAIFLIAFATVNAQDKPIAVKKQCGDLCSRVFCAMPQCCPDEVIIPGDGDCNCCPSCIQRTYVNPKCSKPCEDCSKVACMFPRCADDEIVLNGDGNCYFCCPKCVKQADYPRCQRCSPNICMWAKCVRPTCSEKEIFVPSGPQSCNCCGQCVPRSCDPKKCAAVKCKNEQEIMDSCGCDSVFVPADGDCNCCGKCVKIIQQ